MSVVMLNATLNSVVDLNVVILSVEVPYKILYIYLQRLLPYLVPYATTARNPGANVIKLFTAVISMVIPSFCVIKLYYLGNYLGMAVNYQGIKLFYNIGQKCQWQT
jgi:hypothetical protein